MCVIICGGHHDSDRIAVLVMDAKAESIELCKSSCIMYNCLNKDYIHSFIHSFICVCMGRAKLPAVSS